MCVYVYTHIYISHLWLSVLIYICIHECVQVSVNMLVYCVNMQA